MAPPVETWPVIISSSRSHGFFRDRVHYAEHVLDRVAISQSVALARVDQAGGTRPGVSHQAVERAPHVQHAVELGVGGFDCQAARCARASRLFSAGQLLVGLRDGAELGAPAPSHRCPAHAQQHQKFLGLARVRAAMSTLQRAAAIVADGQRIRARPCSTTAGLRIAADRCQ